MNDNKVDELYDKLLDTSKELSNNNKNALNNLEEIKNNLPEEENLNVLNKENNNTIEGEVVTGIYDPNTGNTTVAAASNDTKELSESHFNKFINDSNKPLEFDEIKNLLDIPESQAKELDEIQDAMKVNNLIKKKNSGIKITYDELPVFLKKSVEDILIKSSSNLSEAYLSTRSKRNYITNLLIQSLADEYNKKNVGIDLDTMLSGFDESINKMQDDMSKEFGDMLMSFDKDRKAEIDAAIERCKAEGKEESIAKLQKMRDTIDDAYNLDKFAEFCKHVRIKKFDLEKPKKIFQSFNNKYEKHANNINDIQYCPVVLDRHLEDHTSNMKLCLAFCKYCMNFSPDNIEDHTFMYYFIRNIILIDRINPKGKLYDSMDDKSKAFYDGFISNIKKCIENLNNR